MSDDHVGERPSEFEQQFHAYKTRHVYHFFDNSPQDDRQGADQHCEIGIDEIDCD